MQTQVYFDRALKQLTKDLSIDPRDVQYLTRRYKSEGVKFLTVTLPKLAKQVTLSLEKGVFLREGVTCFAWKGRSLVNFSSLLSEIFDSKGLVRTDNDVRLAYAFDAIRQLCEYFYKLALSFSAEEQKKAAMKYIAFEKEMKTLENSREWWYEKLRKNFETYYPSISRANAHEILTEFRPRATSGSFADKEVVDQPYWLQRFLPATIRPNAERGLRAFSGFLRPYSGSRLPLRFGDTPKTCKVSFVPKDSRQPRVISAEPMVLLKYQMAYFDFMVDRLQKATAGRVQFKDQKVMQELSQSSSVDRSHATLDLKDASDSVLFALVKRIFKNSPGMRFFINQCRSLAARVKVGDEELTVQLKKLAGMGSGLTFPTMALVIHLSVCTLVALRTRLPLKSVMLRVRVYGDDLIVPREWYDLAVEALNLSHLNVNTEKSFHSGFFRESCGGDYWKGVDVTPVRLKLARARLGEPRDYRDPNKPLIIDEHGILQLERHCRELSHKGLYNLREYYYRQIEQATGPLPTVSFNSPILGRADHDVYVSKHHERAYYPCSVVHNCREQIADEYGLGRLLAPKVGIHNPYFVDSLRPYGEIAEPFKVIVKRRLVSYEDKLAVMPSEEDVKKIMRPIEAFFEKSIVLRATNYRAIVGKPLTINLSL